jgi:hypothetical protein
MRSKIYLQVALSRGWSPEMVQGNRISCYSKLRFKYGPPVCLLSGVPNEVVQRAGIVLEDMHSKKPTRRVTSEKLTATDKQYQVHDLVHNDILRQRTSILLLHINWG